MLIPARFLLLCAVAAGAGACLGFTVEPGALRCDRELEVPCPSDWLCLGPGAAERYGRCYPPGTALAPLVVEPAYPDASRWLDHVRRADPSQPHHAQPGVPCDPAVDDRIGACVHAGELRVARTALPSCAGLDVRDELGVLQWSCDDTAGRALLVATGLRDAAALGDLLTADNFKPNRVLVRQRPGGELLAASEPAAWWDNPVRPLPAGAEPVALAGPGTIYAVSRDTTAGSMDIADDQIAVVVLPGATLSLREGPENCAVATSSGLRHRCLLSLHKRHFVWIEGNLGRGGGAWAVHASSARQLRLRRVRVSGYWHSGLALRDVAGSRLEDVRSHDNGKYGLSITRSAHNVLARISVAGNGPGSTAVADAGLLFDIESHDHAITGLVGACNNPYGLLTGQGSLGAFTIGYSTFAQNSYSGATLGGQGGSALFQILSLRAGTGPGIAFRAPDNQLAGAAVGHQPRGVHVYEGASVVLSHDLLLAGNKQDCVGAAGTVACETFGSGARVLALPSLARSVKGKVTSDDAQNRSDQAGAAQRDAISDWLGFATPYRAWGADGSDAFADASNAGPCADRCRIWDFDLGLEADALRARDAAGQPSAETVAEGRPCPAAAHGDQALTDAGGNTFLLRALELLGDGRGDDDGLCESGEACVYQPHAGAAQAAAHAGRERCVFGDGKVAGVQLYGLVDDPG